MLLLIEKMMWHEFDAPGFKKIVGFSPQQSLSYKLTLIKKNKKRQKKISWNCSRSRDEIENQFEFFFFLANLDPISKSSPFFSTKLNFWLFQSPFWKASCKIKEKAPELITDKCVFYVEKRQKYVRLERRRIEEEGKRKN